MKTKLLTLTLLLGLLIGLVTVPFAGQASAAGVHSPTSNSHVAAFDKTRFVAHLAFAYGAFHHWVYKPYKDGKLTRHHIFTLIKAGAAMLFTYHELKVAYNLANSSNSKILKALVAPLNALAGKFDQLKSKVTSGSYSASDLNNLDSQ